MQAPFADFRLFLLILQIVVDHHGDVICLALDRLVAESRAIASASSISGLAAPGWLSQQ